MTCATCPYWERTPDDRGGECTRVRPGLLERALIVPVVGRTPWWLTPASGRCRCHPEYVAPQEQPE